MSTHFLDWIELILRWAHVMLGIAWIGTSFFFIWLDESLRKRDPDDTTMAGESWMVHGGGFYRSEKFLVAPSVIPSELHWFKYEAYFTWVTGFLLIAIIYYFGAETYLIDTARADLSPFQAIALSMGSLLAGWVVYDLLCRSEIGQKTGLLAVCVFVLILIASWGYSHVFAGRAAFVHIGAFIGTIMAANVFGVIIPGQKKVVAALLAGEQPDPRHGAMAKQRSLHNNYLTLPVLFMMISNHYPATFGHPYAWIVAVGIVVVGALVRHFFNTYDAGKLDWTGKAAIPLAAVAVIGLIVFTGYRPGSNSEDGEKVEFAEVQQVVVKHCSSCHAKNPTSENFEEPPKGVIFDTPEDIRKYATQIRAQVVLSDAMPLGNESGMEQEERDLLGAWVAQGGRID